MRRTVTVLFSSAGRRVELMNCFRADAQRMGLEARLIAVDVNPDMSAACRAADMRFAVPRCLDPQFVPELRRLCREHAVDLVVPTIDTELPALAAAKGDFERAGTRVVVSSSQAVAIARNKLETARAFSAAGILSPVTVPLRELLTERSACRFPVIVKRIDGSSSIGLHEVREPGALDRLGVEVDRYVAQEKWEGAEYTVNAFIDRQGRVRCVVPHQRYETRAGEVSKGVTRRHPLLAAYAERLPRALPGLEGAVCFQAMVTADGRAAAFEVNARFGGGFPLAHRAGAEFPRWLLEERLGLESTASDQWKEGLTMLRYDAAVFVDDSGAPGSQGTILA